LGNFKVSGIGATPPAKPKDLGGPDEIDS